MTSFSHWFLFFLTLSCSPILTGKELVLYNWEEYIAESVLEKFKAASGHSIKLVIFDSDSERDEVMVNLGGKGFDLVVIESISARSLGTNGFLEAFDSSAIKNIEPRWKDACGNYGVPYLWGTVGIVYRHDSVEGSPTSWRDLLEPTLVHQGKIAMLLDATDTLIPPLKLLGKSINDESRESLRAAHGLLKKQEAHVMSYEYIGSYERSDLVSIALGFSGDQYKLNKNDRSTWKYVIPKEGTGLWVDCMTIPASSPNKRAAQTFIEFMNRPDIAAENASELWVATPNSKALQLLDDEFKEDETIFPSDEILNRSEIYKSLSSKTMTLKNRIIYSLKR